MYDCFIVVLVLFRKMEVTKKSRAPRISKHQQVYMVDYMLGHPDWASGRLSGILGKDEQIKRWQTLAAALNQMEGPEKKWEDWRKVGALRYLCQKHTPITTKNQT